MGWLDVELPDHEGFIVGVEEIPGRRGFYQQLPTGRDEKQQPRKIKLVQVACDCGWRSSRIRAPLSTEWMPYTVIADEWFEDIARALWKEHLKTLQHGELSGIHFYADAFSVMDLRLKAEKQHAKL